MEEGTPSGGVGNVRAGRSRRRVVLAGLVALVLVAAGAVAWFQPQKRAEILEAEGGRRFLRLDELRTSNGPDLFVYLSATPADGPRDAFDAAELAPAR